MLSLEDISLRELLERVHSKIEKKNAVLVPAIVQKIREPEEGKSTSPEKGLVDLDLFQVLRTGMLVAVAAAESGWELILRGVTLDGENLFVAVYLSHNANAPLQIKSVASVRESFMKVMATLSSEEQVTTQQFINYLRQKSPSPDAAFHDALDSFVREHRVLLQNLAR